MKKYFSPEINFKAFNFENIITTSAIDGVELTKSELGTAGITSVQTKSLDTFNQVEQVETGSFDG